MRAKLLLFGLVLAVRAAYADQTVNVGPGFTFSPDDVTITPGETITWVFLEPFHSSTSDLQTGPEVWDSGVLTSGTFAHTFTTPGNYPYYCTVHSVPGGTMMNAIIRVAAPPPALTVTQVNPTAGVPGSLITITGSAFVNGATVRFNATNAAAVSFVSDTTLTAQVPSLAPGVYDVTVTNPDTTSATLAQAFVVLDPAGIPALSPTVLLALAGALIVAALLKVAR